MKNTLKLVFLFSILYVANSSVQAQVFNTGPTFPQVIPKSPEVMGMERYGGCPVSEYTGTPSINIPLHTIKIKDFEFPISLDYHATGILVTQEATWVGLGWNLIAGGCISVSAVGAIDNPKATPYATTSDWNFILNYSKPYWQAQAPFGYPPMPDGVPATFNAVDPNAYLNSLYVSGYVIGDTFGNFNGGILQNELAAKFNHESNIPEYRMTKEARIGSGERDIYNVSILGQSFEFSIHPTTGAYIYNGEKNKYKIEKSGNSWHITDEFGYLYKFGGGNPNGGDREFIDYYIDQFTSKQLESWFLSEIVYQGNTLVKINYNKSANVQKLPVLSESCEYIQGNTQKYRTNRNCSWTGRYSPMYLSSIITPLDSIVFITDTRNDMQGAYKLLYMRVISRSSKTLQKKYQFDYDYFTGSSTGMGTTYSSASNYIKQRLKLTQIVQWDNTNAKSMKYEFKYNENTNFPCKTSFSQDLWGYFNNEPNLYQGSFTSSTNCGIYSTGNTLLPTVSFIKQGETVISYLQNFTGANRETNKGVITIGMLKSITYPTGGKTEFEFESHDFLGAYGGKGGGVRIKKITNYTDDTTIASIKRYKYVKKDGTTSGKLIHPMKFTDQYYTKEPTHSLSDYTIFNRVNSSNVWNYSTSGSDAVVGYDRVEIEDFSADEKNSTGKKIVEFNSVVEISAYPEYNIYIPSNKITPIQNSSILNGKITSSTILNENNDTISVEKYAYNIENIEKNYINIRKMEKDLTLYDILSWVNVYILDEKGKKTGKTGVIYFGATMACYLPVLMVYPTTNYTTYLTKKEETAYFGTNKVSKTTNFEYDPLNYKIKKITETIDGKNHIKEYKYPLNYGAGDFFTQKALVDSNMISIPIEEFTFLNTTPIQSKKTEYNPFNNSTILAPNKILLKNGTNAYETRLKYENYDKFGNPQYITKDNADKVVYLWGYNYQYPIAKIENATYAEVTAKISETALETIAKKLAPSTTDFTTVNNLRTQLPNAMITTYTYKPSVGILTVTDPRGTIIIYTYDFFNRLQTIKDVNGITVEDYEYHYKN